ncbi:cytoplasmic glycerophosphodiester phosphodiesterase [compost metagenome]
MKKKAVLTFAIFLSLIILPVAIWPHGSKKQAGTGYAAYRIVAHAMGGIDGHPYTNAFEAFVANYEKGTRLFETDLLLTSDERLVARHEWTQNMSKLLNQWDTLPADKREGVPAYADFMDTPILDIYSAMDWDTVLDLLEHYPDAYIVTDIKKSGSKSIMDEFEMLVDATQKRDPALLNRIIPQIYNRPMLEQLNQIYAFPEVIYTLYESPDSDEQVIDFVEQTGVNITMPVSRANKNFISKLKDAGARVYVHTLNEPDDIGKLYRLGADGFYSDFISEDELEKSGALRRISWGFGG